MLLIREFSHFNILRAEVPAPRLSMAGLPGSMVDAPNGDVGIDRKPSVLTLRFVQIS
jgi:hypothetical protein